MSDIDIALQVIDAEIDRLLVHDNHLYATVALKVVKELRQQIVDSLNKAKVANRMYWTDGVDIFHRLDTPEERINLIGPYASLREALDMRDFMKKCADDY